MHRHLLSLSTGLLLSTALASSAMGASPEPASPAAASPTPISSAVVKGPVFVDGTDILYLESFPVQVRLVVSGSLPTPCHAPAWRVEASTDAIDVTLWSEAPADAVCASVLEPFEVSIPLGAFESADLALTLDGEDIGRVVVGVPSGDPPTSPLPSPSLASALVPC
jgi:hypothetical protein